MLASYWLTRRETLTWYLHDNWDRTSGELWVMVMNNPGKASQVATFIHDGTKQHALVIILSVKVNETLWNILFYVSQNLYNQPLQIFIIHRSPVWNDL